MCLFKTDSTDSQDCLPVVLSISVLYFFSFSVLPIFSCWFVQCSRLQSLDAVGSRDVKREPVTGFKTGNRFEK